MVISKITFQVSVWVLGILFSGNIFFIKRLVDNLDKTTEMVWQMRQEIVVLKFAIDHREGCRNKPLKGE